ncbi:hypothetical protein IFM89_012725 [Coptis chinensis]|uniref:R3H domain-containing protein n=1 Tax=Coptis chinensis TaxID=261450 RepID=A0A835LL74_9MAGN|nr:hypothetical protein IFM89_012725 [Coptis chinensis]
MDSTYLRQYKESVSYDHIVYCSLDGILELKPMSLYNRLLLHRLADIFGLAHKSVGEGDDRHLILEGSPESSIPSVLVSDILWQCNDY